MNDKSAVQAWAECAYCKTSRGIETERWPRHLSSEVLVQVIENIGRVCHGSVEIKIQDARIVQIDTLEKTRLK